MTRLFGGTSSVDIEGCVRTRYDSEREVDSGREVVSTRVSRNSVQSEERRTGASMLVPFPRTLNTSEMGWSRMTVLSLKKLNCASDMGSGIKFGIELVMVSC